MTTSDQDNRDETLTPMPQWVKLLAGIALAVLFVVVLLHLTGHAPFGHGTHMMPSHQGVPQP